MRMLQLTTKAYCAAILLDGKGKCVDSAPILRWMIGKGEQWIRHHCKRHQIQLVEVASEDGRGRRASTA